MFQLPHIFLTSCKTKFNKVACKFLFKFVVLLQIVNDNPLLTIVNILANNCFLKRSFFSKAIVFKKQPYKKRSQIVLKKRPFFKKIVIRFLKFQNEWVVFKNDRFFPKTKRSFLKTIKKRNKKRLFNDRFQKRLTTLVSSDNLTSIFNYNSITCIDKYREEGGVIEGGGEDRENI